MNLIVAVDKNWGIGRDGGLLASLPGDMAYFKEHTMDKTVVMGRKTLESMPGKRGLPGRVNFVLTGNPDFTAERCEVFNSEEDLFAAINKCEPDDVFLIGGASIYNKYYKMCDTLYITKIDADLGADAHIVNIDNDTNFHIVSESEPMTENGITYRFVVYRGRG